MMPLPAARAASMCSQPRGALDQFHHLVVRAQPHRQQFDDGLAGLADGLPQQTFAIASGRAQAAVEQIAAHAPGMAARRPVNEPAQSDAQPMQQRQRQAGQQLEQEHHAGN